MHLRWLYPRMMKWICFLKQFSDHSSFLMDSPPFPHCFSDPFELWGTSVLASWTVCAILSQSLGPCCLIFLFTAHKLLLLPRLCLALAWFSNSYMSIREPGHRLLSAGTLFRAGVGLEKLKIWIPQSLADVEWEGKGRGREVGKGSRWKRDWLPKTLQPRLHKGAKSWGPAGRREVEGIDYDLGFPGQAPVLASEDSKGVPGKFVKIQCRFSV